ncbi:hypothetical protein PSHI8_19800 [Polynucleobacter sp. SHI8]|uniref:hypothetical protein n=1 Tax=unclassified Polynucleobacter TaxID=2640945 RepID=UPI002492C037|nr:MULTISPECIES: hypothetical protein [unclassified Polynucleobacter]BDW11897.1 hypothetical protein PSHI2_19790 [Polynucleobacter sp. SHI2]BDW14344.1 hypothetical protein PSHI8_19800 [Polynucleobacter sp. SHI8]
MNNILNLFFRYFLGTIITLILLTPNFSHAQASNSTGPSKSQILNQQELDAINRQPIAPKVYASDGVQGVQKRETSFSYQEDSGTRVQEFRDVGQNTEIQVDSGMGTHYQMSPVLDKDLDSTRQTINRVPSINLPF